MNNERNTPDSDCDDRLVSATYREIANERPSDALDRTIMRQARVAAKPKYLRSMSWMRPTAWAATIALCFAIALEVTRVPSPESVLFNSSADAIDRLGEEDRQRKVGNSVELRSEEDRERKDENAVDFRDEAKLKTTLSGVAEPEAAPLGDTDISAPANLPARIEPTEKKRSDDISSLHDLPNPPAPSVADEFMIENSDIMRDAEDIARSQRGNNQEAAPAVHARSLSAATYAIDADQSCDKDSTLTPATWIACIQELENAGQSDAADKQREQLKLAFPDFEFP